MFGRILLGCFALALAVAGGVRLARTPPPPLEVGSRPVAPPRNEEPQGLGRPEMLRRETLPPSFERLKALAVRKRPPGPDDWLANHLEEGQSLSDWRGGDPVRVSDRRRTLYLQPLGDFTSAQRRVLTEAADYLERYFGVPVKMQEARPLSTVPASAKRRNPLQGQRQIWTGWVLEALHERRPDDALAYVALTAVDLFPQDSWNFVYGQASLKERVGVWSMWRFGDPDDSGAAFDRVLRRTIGTAVHEMGHMLTIHHCVAWECVMNGVNHGEEADAAPLEPCPADLAKLCEATGCDPAARFDRLIEFWEQRPTASPGTLTYLWAARATLDAAAEP